MVHRLMHLRASKYLFFAAVAVPFNMLVFQLARNDMPVLAANILAYVVGAQINFLGQDRGTFVDLFDSPGGKFTRWWRFMVGQSMGAGINTGGAVLWLLVGAPAWMINGLAMLASGAFNYVWIHYVSHNPRRRGSRGKHAPPWGES